MAITRDECPRLLSLAVHEFRTPVTVVAGYIRMLLKMHTASLSDQQKKLLEEAEKSCGRLSALIAELSELANFDAGHAPLDEQDVDLFPLLAEVVKSVHGGADRDVHLETVEPGERAIVRGDPRRLREALSGVLEATVRERVEPGVLLARGGVSRDGRDAFAWVTVSPGDATNPGDDFRASDWAAFQQWRGGLGFRLVFAQQVIAAHGGQLFSGIGETARGTSALTLPVKE